MMDSDHSIAGLCQQVVENFRDYREGRSKFFVSLELWLWCMPLLQEEENQEEIVASVLAAIVGIVDSAGEEVDILEVVRFQTRRAVSRLRLRDKVVYDPQLIDKLAVGKPHGVRDELPERIQMQKLSPLSRLLISLRQRGLSKREIAEMLFVSASQVTNYFKKLEQELAELCGDK